MPRTSTNGDTPRYSMIVTAFERRSWLVQRIGWAAMVIFIAAALGGGFGEGPVGAVVRPAIIYLSLMLIFRLTGKRSIGEISTFDFLLLLVVSEAVSEALLAGDTSLIGAVLAATTLVGIDVLMSLAKRQWPAFGRILEDEPVVLYFNGKLQAERLRKERVSEGDILEAARLDHGIDSLDMIHAAVLERRGKISIIPLRDA